MQDYVDIFKGRWISKLPNGLVSGSAPLFDDERVKWFIHHNDVLNKLVLELGSLEGGHSYMLEKAGAVVDSIENNLLHYLKCCLVKSLFELKGVNFINMDIFDYLKLCVDYPEYYMYYICFASGILYHTNKPLELIKLISQVCNIVFVWTHYEAAFTAEQIELNYGFSCTGYKHYYQKDPNIIFLGGKDKYTIWLSRGSIIEAFRYFGFNKFDFNFEEPNHPNGPAFAFIARK